MIQPLPNGLPFNKPGPFTKPSDLSMPAVTSRACRGVRETRRDKGQPGWVYVIHASKPLCHAQHYVGITWDLETRIIEHLTAAGAALCNAFNFYRISWDVVHVMRGGYDLEAYVKSWHGARAFCPVCRAGAGFETVKCSMGKGAATYRPIREVVVPEAVRALTQGPLAITPSWRPFAMGGDVLDGAAGGDGFAGDELPF